MPSPLSISKLLLRASGGMITERRGLKWKCKILKRGRDEEKRRRETEGEGGSREDSISIAPLTDMSILEWVFLKTCREMWTQCRECDKTSLSIHERGSEFLVTIGSVCQIWWGLHSDRVRWLVKKKKKKASGFGVFCPLSDMRALLHGHVFGYVYMCGSEHKVCVVICWNVC